MRAFWVFLLALVTCFPCFGTRCLTAVNSASRLPRELSAAATFEALVRWVHEDVIVRRGAPGLVVGISGTDSILAFLATAKAFERAGRPERAVGIHYNNGEPGWFETEIIPWLRTQVPGARIIVDRTVNHRLDGARWGALMDWSVIENPENGRMRPPAERYWVVGTRNATEVALRNYSLLSMAATVQVIPHLWKSEVLALCRFLGVPRIAMDASCEADCACGRDQLPAIHIPEVDAILMARAGQLSPSYLESTIPAALRLQLETYVDVQLRDTAFRDVIPHEPAPENFTLQSNPGDAIVDAARTAILAGATELRAISRAVPSIVAGRRANVASELMGVRSTNRDAWLPEAMALFNTPGLRSAQLRRMLQHTFFHEETSLPEIRRLSRITGQLANYGFSFPQWLHLSERFAGEPSLAVQFGFVRPDRNTDEQWGPGLVLSSDREYGEWHVEYRRSYLLCSQRNGATIIVRNNSHYYGRDRLEHAFYVSWTPRTADELRNLTEAQLASFTPYRDFLVLNREIPVREKIRRLEALLTHLDETNARMQVWLRGPGFASLLRYWRHKLSRASEIYLGVVEGTAPSWAPTSVERLTPELVARMERAGTVDIDGRVVMMSGPAGDFP